MAPHRLGRIGRETPTEEIRGQIDCQRHGATGHQSAARKLAKWVECSFGKNHRLSGRLKGGDRKGLLRRIADASCEEGFALSRGGWRQIEREATLDELRGLTMLAMAPLIEAEACHWREHFLESPDLWPLLGEILPRD